MINLTSDSHKESKEISNIKIIPPKSENILHKIDFSNIIMSGTAKRKTFEEKNNHLVKSTQKKNFKESLMKLRTPFYKSHQKQSQEEKLMTKSCEILFECIKPYKDIRITKKAKMKESVRNVGNFLKTTNIIYEWKATRNVQLITFPYEKSMPNFFLKKQKTFFSATNSPNWNNQNFKENLKVAKSEDFVEANDKTNQAGRTVSSEDFITNVLSE